MQNAFVVDDSIRGEVSPIAVRQLTHAAVASGVAAESLPHLLRGPAGWVSLEAFATAWETLAKGTGDASLPVLLAEHARVEDFELVGYLLAACGTLGECLEVLVLHGDLWITGASWQLGASSTTTTLRFAFDSDFGPSRRNRERVGLRCVVESILALTLRLLRLVTNGSLTPVLVRIAHPEPSTTALHRSFFGAPTVFGATEDALVLNLTDLDLPIPTGAAVPGLRSVLEEHACVRRSSAPVAKRTSDRVREILLAHAQAKGVRVRPEDVAARLGSSERSLRRKLDGEGTSFREIHDEVLCARARAALDRGEPIDAIARRLGFEGRSAFARAFRRWTGASPREFRKVAAAARPT